MRLSVFRRLLESVPLLALPVVAVIAIGRPDLDAAIDFFATSSPSYASGVAAVGLVVWIAVAALVLGQFVLLWRLPRRAVPTRSASRRSLAMLLLGLAIFLGGLARHSSGLGTICCGNLSQATQLAR